MMDEQVASITVVDETNKLVLERRWYNSYALGVLFLSVVWNLLLILFTTLPSEDEADPLAVLLILVLGLVGMIIGYWGLAMLFNKTTITVDRKNLHVAHAPLPWLDKTVEISALERVESGAMITNKNSPREINRMHYLTADLKDGTHKTLLHGLRGTQGAAEVEFIKERVNAYLVSHAPLAEDEQVVA